MEPLAEHADSTARLDEIFDQLVNFEGMVPILDDDSRIVELIVAFHHRIDQGVRGSFLDLLATEI